MGLCSSKLQFERAIEYKKALDSLTSVQDKQAMTFNKKDACKCVFFLYLCIKR